MKICKKRHWLLLLFSSLFFLLLISCDNNSRPDNGLETPDVTKIGILKPIAKYTYMYDSEDSYEYLFKYTSDNRCNAFSGDNWSMNVAPLAFVKQNGTKLDNFLINGIGLVSYFEEKQGSVIRMKYYMDYDNSYRIKEIVIEDLILGCNTKKIFNYDSTGRLLEIKEYSNEELSKSDVFEYDSLLMKNSDGLFVNTYLETFGFLQHIGLLGAPSSYLPSKCLTKFYFNNNTSVMNTIYEYTTKSGHVIYWIENWDWVSEGLQGKSLAIISYKGLYLDK